MYIARANLLDQVAQSPSQAAGYFAEPSRINIARFFAEEMAAQLGPTHPEVAADLEKLVSHLFASNAQEYGLFKSLIAKYRYKPVEYRLLVSNYVRVGHFIEIAGHLERENLFDIYRKRRDAKLDGFNPETDPLPVLDEDDIVPGGIERILFPMAKNGQAYVKRDVREHLFETAEAAVDALSAPVFAPIFTTHPTYVDTLRTQQLLREMHDAWREMTSSAGSFADHAFKRVQSLVGTFMNTELTPVSVDANGQAAIRNFTAKQESALERDVLRQMWNGLPDVYKTFEDALDRRFGKEYDNKLRTKLNLQLEPMSWIHFDKDGNDNLKAEHSLQAVVRRRILLLGLAIGDIAELDKMRLPLKHGDAHWRHILGEVRDRLAAIDDRLELARKGGDDIPLSQKAFDQCLTDLQNAYIIEWVAQDGYAPDQMLRLLRADINSAKEHANNERHGDALLMFSRKIKTFGLKFAYSEYRETSEEYSRTLGVIIDRNPFTGEPFNYEDIKPSERAVFIDRVLREQPGFFRDAVERFLSRIDSTGHLRTYSKDHPEAIAYHTLKRAQLAAAQPDMFRDTVLAECQDEANVMEALALQHAFTPANYKPHADMFITPLLEDLDRLEAAPDIVLSLLRLESYRDHMVRLAGGDLSKLQIKIQVAHSDNVRRGGTPAARAAIHEIHATVPATLDKYAEDIKAMFAANGQDVSNFKIGVEWSEGGSASDVLRNGKRAMTALINAFGLHHYFKQTLQGNDLFGFFGLKTSFKRMMARFYTHCAKENAFNESHPAIANGKKQTRYRSIVTQALKDTVKDYERGHFNRQDNQIGYLFAHPLVNYPLYGKVFNRGLRAAVRGKKSQGTVYDDYQASQKGTVPIPTDTVRTIGFSNVLKDANLLATWFGARHFVGRFTELLTKDLVAMQDLQERLAQKNPGAVLFEADKSLGKAVLNFLYHDNAMFRDVVDKVAYGIADSDIAKLQQRLNVARDEGIPITPEINAYVQNLRLEYEQACLLVLDTLGVDTAQIAYSMRSTSNDAYLSHLKALVQEKGLPTLAENLVLKERFSSFLGEVRDDIIVQGRRRGTAQGDRNGLTNNDMLMLSDIASGTLIARHGRDFRADDPHYAETIARHQAQVPQPR